MAISRKDLEEAFAFIDSQKLNVSKMLMNEQDAADLGFGEPCHRCGKRLFDSSAHDATACDLAIASSVMDS